MIPSQCPDSRVKNDGLLKSSSYQEKLTEPLLAEILNPWNLSVLLRSDVHIPSLPSGSPTQALFGLVDEPLESRDLQKAKPLCDGVEKQEAVRPADGGLQGSCGAFLEQRRGRKEKDDSNHCGKLV